MSQKNEIAPFSLCPTWFLKIVLPSGHYPQQKNSPAFLFTQKSVKMRPSSVRGWWWFMQGAYGTQVMVSDRPSWGAGVSWISRTLSQCDKQICVTQKKRSRFWILLEVAWRLTSSNHKSWIPPWAASYCTAWNKCGQFSRSWGWWENAGLLQTDRGRPTNPT